MIKFLYQCQSLLTEGFVNPLGGYTLGKRFCLVLLHSVSQLICSHHFFPIVVMLFPTPHCFLYPSGSSVHLTVLFFLFLKVSDVH